MIWLLFAALSALFAGATSILAKVGLRNTDSDVATALRTGVVLVFAWLMVVVTGAWSSVGEVDARSMLFLLLSGLATGGSWLCYFRALTLGDVNKVTPVDKSSTVLSMLFAVIFLSEALTWAKGLGMAAIAVGTFLMIQKKKADPPASAGHGWLFFALLSAVFAALTSVLGKIGIENVNSNVGTAVRTCVVLVMAWVVVFAQKKQRLVRRVDKKGLLFIVLSGIATGASWLCYYRAIQMGEVSVVVPVDKLSILVTIAFSYFVLKEKLTLRALAGLALITAGTLGMIFIRV